MNNSNKDISEDKDKIIVQYLIGTILYCKILSTEMDSITICNLLCKQLK